MLVSATALCPDPNIDLSGVAVLSLDWVHCRPANSRHNEAAHTRSNHTAESQHPIRPHHAPAMLVSATALGPDLDVDLSRVATLDRVQAG